MIHYLDDKVIINKLKEGDVLSFDSIFRKYHKKVYYFALSYLKNKEEAEDIVQEVFMNIWRSRDQISEYHVFSKYLFKITYNATCKRFRKQASDKRHLEEVLKNISVEDDSTNIEIEYNNLIQATRKLIDELPSREKEILVLSVEKQLSAEKISEMLRISLKTVENYLSRAKSSIRKSLANGGMLSLLFVHLFIK